MAEINYDTKTRSCSVTLWCPECRELTHIWDVQNDENYDGLEPDGIACSVCKEVYPLGQQAQYAEEVRQMRSWKSSGCLSAEVRI